MKKIIFILSAAQNSHCKNRIEEFMNFGFEVEVFAFLRINQPMKEFCYKVNLIGEIENAKYTNRLSLYRKKIKDIIKGLNPKDCIIYLFGLDLALAFNSVSKKFDYIYEEADLTYTYIENHFIRNVLKSLDKYVIKKSYKTVLTSDGFVNYLYKGNKPLNVFVLPNKLNPSICNIEKQLTKKTFNKDKIVIGFVGVPRFKTIYNFIKNFCQMYPSYEFHVFGGPIDKKIQELGEMSNCYIHGYFNNPTDLPEIYESIDLVLSTYDTEFDNVKYAEPNKIYEAIYFETPIIVSSGTFLAEKVDRLNIGYHINAMDIQDIKRLIDSLSKESIEDKVFSIKKIDKNETIVDNSLFIKSLSQ